MEYTARVEVHGALAGCSRDARAQGSTAAYDSWHGGRRSEPGVAPCMPAVGRPSSPPLRVQLLQIAVFDPQRVLLMEEMDYELI